jgi:cytochrome c oxidase assembly protein subunit 15
VAYGLGRPRRAPDGSREWMALLIVGLVLLQVSAGAFVAGLDAGMGYNTWPLMDGQFVPDGLLIMSPWWANLFENAMTVQFLHRMLAYLVAIVVAVNLWRSTGWRGRSGALQTAWWLMLAVLAQIGLGIWTLLAQVPITVALLHQGGALLVLVAALVHLHRLLAQKAPVAPLTYDPEVEAAKLRRAG